MTVYTMAWSLAAIQKASFLLNSIETLLNSSPELINSNLSTQTVQSPLGETVVLHNFNKLLQVLSKTINVIMDALRLYGPHRLFVSFNGGKDASVVLYLYCACLIKCNRENLATSSSELFLNKPVVVYFNEETKDFPEVTEFVHFIAEEWDLHLQLLGGDIKEGISRCIAQTSESPLGFILGTRKDDPNSLSQHFFSPSSFWMPPFLRINPILEWNYKHIWNFLLYFKLPYCELYNRGFTSIGDKYNTIANPLLETLSGVYIPAYLLENYSQEREGRLSDRPYLTSEKINSKNEEISAERSPTETLPSIADRNTWRQIVFNATTASLIVIGNELLKGQIIEKNTRCAVDCLRVKGIELHHVAFIRDTVADITEEVQRQALRYDIVITSGGLGPTHDDVTSEAVAKAFGQRMKVNTEMLKAIRNALRKQNKERNFLSSGLLKMAVLPEIVHLWFKTSCAQEEESISEWPLIQCANVFLLPGIPTYFAQQMECLCENYLKLKEFSTCQISLLSKECWKVHLTASEESIIHTLNEVVSQFPDVAIGSYPLTLDTMEDGDETVITFESSNESKMQNALTAFIDALSSNQTYTISTNHLSAMQRES